MTLNTLITLITLITGPVQGLHSGHVVPVEADHALEAPVEGRHQGPVLVAVGQPQAVTKLVCRGLQQVSPGVATQAPMF